MSRLVFIVASLYFLVSFVIWHIVFNIYGLLVYDRRGFAGCREPQVFWRDYHLYVDNSGAKR